MAADYGQEAIAWVRSRGWEGGPHAVGPLGGNGSNGEMPGPEKCVLSGLSNVLGREGQLSLFSPVFIFRLT